jgi:hypothetical protein
LLDQIQFMSGLLGLPALRTRVERYFQFQALHVERYRIGKTPNGLMSCAMLPKIF